MIEKLSQTSGNVLALRATGKLTTADYENEFIPDLVKLIEEHGTIRVLLHLDDSFAGWEAGAAWEDAKFGVKYRKNFERLAVVGGPKYVEWGVKLSAHFMDGEIKTYQSGELDKALTWIAE